MSRHEPTDELVANMPTPKVKPPPRMGSGNGEARPFFLLDASLPDAALAAHAMKARPVPPRMSPPEPEPTPEPVAPPMPKGPVVPELAVFLAEALGVPPAGDDGDPYDADSFLAAINTMYTTLMDVQERLVCEVRDLRERQADVARRERDVAFRERRLPAHADLVRLVTGVGNLGGGR